MKRKTYFEDPIVFMTWYTDKHKLPVDIKVLIEEFNTNQDFKHNIIQKMNDENDRRKNNLSSAGVKAGTENWEKGLGLSAMDPKRRSQISSENGKKVNKQFKEEGKGFYGMSSEKRSSNGKKGNATNKANGTALYGMSSEEKAKAAKKLVTSALESGNHNSFKLKEAAKKRYLQVYEMMPDTFTNKDIKNMLTSIGIAKHNNSQYKNYWLNNQLMVIIHHGKRGCNYDVDIFKKCAFGENR